MRDTIFAPPHPEVVRPTVPTAVSARTTNRRSYLAVGLAALVAAIGPSGAAAQPAPAHERQTTARAQSTCPRNVIRGNVVGRADLEGNARFSWRAEAAFRQEPSPPPCGITGRYDLQPTVGTFRHFGDLIGPRGKFSCPLDETVNVRLPTDDPYLDVVGKPRRGQSDGPPYRYLAGIRGPRSLPRKVTCPDGYSLEIPMGPALGLTTLFQGGKLRPTDGVAFQGTRTVSGAIGPRMNIAPRGVNHTLTGTTTWTWSMYGTISPTRAPVAQPRWSPRPVVRTGVVTLDGRSSRPGTDGRRITSYRWKVTPAADCPADLPRATTVLTGAVVKFQALCSLAGTLTVTDDRGHTSRAAPFAVVVSGRAGWLTARSRRAEYGDLGVLRAPCLICLFGINRDADGGGAGVLLHRSAVDQTFRSGGAYGVARLHDTGPFDGLWYVASEDLRLNRVEVVNAALAESGAIDTTNRAVAADANPEGWDIAALRASVFAHEAAHSRLMHQAVNGPDPAVRIEALSSTGEAALESAVEGALRESDACIAETTAHANVAKVLVAQGWGRGGAVGLPSAADPNVYETTPFASYAQLGAEAGSEPVPGASSSCASAGP